MKTPKPNRSAYPAPIMSGIACWFLSCRNRYRIECPGAFNGSELIDSAGFALFMLGLEGEA
jgi:hypothetical protein